MIVSTFAGSSPTFPRSEEHTSELQSQSNLVCRLLLEKKKNKTAYVSGGVDNHTDHPDSFHRMAAGRSAVDPPPAITITYCAVDSAVPAATVSRRAADL